MPRAFLCHSTDDKPYVEEVAERLGRYRALIDSRVFQPGEDFRHAIRRSMDDADIFVFFVSRRSLASSWVQFELDEAELRSLRGTLRRSLAIFIDGPINPTALPPWLARVKAVQHTTPGQSARTIESLLMGVSDQERPFIGRNDELQRGVRKIASADPSPRILVAYGLDGIGRRSFLRRLVRDALSLDLGPVIQLDSAATLEDLFLESHLSSTMLTREDAEAQLVAFRGLSDAERAVEVAAQLAFLAEQGTVPCIVDKGALLDSQGHYLDEYAEILRRVLVERDVYLSIAHSRAPQYRELDIRWQIFERRLRALQTPDMQALLGRLLRESNIDVTPEQTARLAEVAAGYPPAAYYLVSQIEDYGVDVVLGDPARVLDFQSGSFSRFLRDLKLPNVEREILIYLASETRLSLAGIAAATGHSLERTARAIGQLVDLNIVEMLEEEYSVAAPIQTTVLRTEDGLGRNWYEAAFGRLEAEYWSDERVLPPISVVDATLRAGFRLGRRVTQEYGSLVRPSLLIHAAQEKYHRRDYAGALEYLQRAERMGATTVQLLEIRIKSLAQLGRFREARTALQQYRQSGERRQWYLDGFVARKMGEHDRACGKFQEGYARKDRSVSLLRDYADSLLRTDAVEEAAAIAREALEREPGNIYLLDLVARIEIAGGSIADAEAALDALQAADIDGRFHLHRRAAFLLQRRGTAEAARRAVALAEEATHRRDAPLDAYIILAHGRIRLQDWDALEAVKEEIAKRRKKDSRETLRALDLETEIRRGNWRRAERLLPVNPRTADERDTVAAVLDLKSGDPSVLLTDRQNARQEADRLRRGDAADGRALPLALEMYE